jgi:hypothetical protein
VVLHPDDKEKTILSTGQRLWHSFWKVPATFERLMETVVRGVTCESCLLYLDDVIVIGRTVLEHLLNLLKVFSGSEKPA